ncbi:MAG: SAM-dependent methyltransferase [Rhizobiales bacterium]|nr:SAM-dependent methyltransferase [Hyphomicrobiales bacterium]MBI3672541.1 SAM-dependent methyltransferase [Hyphomicrobiales bacterium]
MIDSDGPMRLDRYLGLCLGHPQYGYYMARQPFGEAGDFITAPEISQAFGELIGVWCAAFWQAMGRPARLSLVELGPGRGTLMSDMLRAAPAMAGFAEAVEVHLVETSPALRAEQKQRLAGATWHARLDTVPAGPMLLVANEFFDALPIRQFEKRQGQWHERVVGLDGELLALGLIAAEPGQGGRDGDVMEVSSARTEIAGTIGRRLIEHSGAALIIDYGHLQSAPGDTLQALRRHTFVPVTEAPGECDITSHVDFEALGKALAAAGAKVAPAFSQRSFLLAMGLEARTAALAAKADAATRERLQRAKTRLADEAEMGNLFKVLAATSPGLAIPYPFAEP